ncbi:iron complex transport system permease protein [Thermolongibacillus altinsuensis]|uniref:Iron complex transport system permease protein n=1 Tax=Thermolongibacillus altinsuensis TaxID=575256 RepID=A0A4V2QAP7_9BACL|nr:iron ABC transporter permease [Thermolongibacillus altinsuensis]TCL53312.1 iron complex transport system permease protein [Thermolongibacillus altinsuensis]
MNGTERRKNVQRLAILAVFSVLILIVFVISMNTGYSRLSPLEVFQTLFGMGTEKQELILFEFRLPRIVISLLVGAGLAVSGCIMQTISRNALADPSILGITHGAGVMVVLYLSFFPTQLDVPVLFLPILAFIGGLLAAALVFGLSYEKYEGLLPTRLVLTGVAVAAGLSALMTVLSLRLSRELYQFVAVWLTGSIWGATWDHVLALLPWIIVLFVFVYYKALVLDVLSLGKNVATGLGASVSKEQVILLAAAVGLAAACVSVSGGIGFVGLIGPHLARRLIGLNHKYLLPASALAGALLLLTADTIGRTILQPSEIHAGIVVAVIGAPYFLYLLARSNH